MAVSVDRRRVLAEEIRQRRHAVIEGLQTRPGRGGERQGKRRRVEDGARVAAGEVRGSRSVGGAGGGVGGGVAGGGGGEGGV